METSSPIQVIEFPLIVKLSSSRRCTLKNTLSELLMHPLVSVAKTIYSVSETGVIVYDESVPEV